MPFCAIAGSYERVLFGYDFELPSDDDHGKKMRSRFVCAAHDGCIKGVGCHKELVISASSDETLKIFNIEDKIELGTLIKHTAGVTCVEFFQSTHVLTGSDDSTITIWKCEDWEPLATLKGHKGGVLSIAIHPTGKLALSTSKDKTLKMWNLLKGKVAYTTKLSAEGEIVKFSPSATSYFVVSDKTITIYDGTTGEERKTITHTKRILAAAFIKDDVVAAGGEDHSINFWNLEGKSLGTFKAHNNRLKGIATLPTPPKKEKAPKVDYSKYLLTISSDGFLKLWDIEDYNKPKTLLEQSTSARLTCLTCTWVEDSVKKEKKKSDENEDEESDDNEVVSAEIDDDEDENEDEDEEEDD